MPLCRHCENAHADASRGLCSKCYNKTSIRSLYPRQSHRQQDRKSTEDMTMAELDALIAEQLPTMPGFDAHEDAMDRKRDRLRRTK